MLRSFALALLGAAVATPAFAAGPATAHHVVASQPGKVPAMHSRAKEPQRCGFAQVNPSGSRIAGTAARSTQGCDQKMSPLRGASK